ncbi:Secreted beta-glucosidase sun1 [Penicillium cosmopolitanum]|uniref:Secreted beta-glucosidase sun1 n=1 Tax=Penicillium cosmopolitanum TaxID=1131564 RepID=A0A9W9W7S8_9EURO|nr:Secreted beta-glucosidase sun1 [Penicillium cosmopolitanum]KAJ5407887.1 Secreted beta-glucosidase sun1 [Penicillium cosmopolitanum]
MKFSNSVAVTLATAGSLVAAHGHGHAHFHKRAVETETDTAVVAGPTVYDFVVLEKSGKTDEISNKDACAGLADDSLEWYGDAVANACPTSTPTPTPSSTSTPTQTPTIAAQELLETSAAITPNSPSPTSTAEPTTSSSSSTSSVASTSSASTSTSSSSSSYASAKGLTTEFPDGEIDCGTFPSEYGAVALPYLGLGGFSGIQYVTLLDEVISDIVTAVSGESCTEGAMCSYACPAGFQKAHWPSTQGSTGQSVGGLHCKGGKLYRTNEAHSTLCIEGTGGVEVENNVGQQVAVCRTDYPGTESETIPLGVGHGETQPLTCPNGATYFKWEGKSTSAQYYVNNAGVSPEEGCQWGNGSSPIGNWAPMNLGVGYSAGSTWLSMFKNEPTTDADLDFAITLTGDVSIKCSYDGKGNFYKDGVKITDGSNGCTAASPSGNAKFVFSSA